MSKTPIHDKNIVFERYATRNPVKLMQRKEQYEQALKTCSQHLREVFKGRIALINKVFKVEEPKEEEESKEEPKKSKKV